MMESSEFNFNTKSVYELVENLNLAYTQGNYYFLIRSFVYPSIYSLINLYEVSKTNPLTLNKKVENPFKGGGREHDKIILNYGKFYQFEIEEQGRLLLNVQEPKWLELDSNVDFRITFLTAEEYLEFTLVVKELKEKQDNFKRKLLYEDAGYNKSIQTKSGKSLAEEPEEEQMNLAEFLKPEEDENPN